MSVWLGFTPESSLSCHVLSHVQICDYVDCSHQASLSLGFPRQEYWNFLLQGIFPTQGSNQYLLCLLHYRQILYLLSHWESPYLLRVPCKSVLNWQFSTGWNIFCLLQTLNRERLGTLSFVGNGFWESSVGWLHLTFRLWFHADAGSPPHLGPCLCRGAGHLLMATGHISQFSSDLPFLWNLTWTLAASLKHYLLDSWPSPLV